MTSRRLPLFFAISIPTLLVMGALAGGCSSDDTTNLPYFEGGVGEGGAFDSGANDAGNEGGGEASTDGGTTDSGPASDASTDGSVVDSGDGGPPVGGLVISQVQSRGSAGAGDEFVEIYNPTTASITFDATWSLKTRSAASCTTAAPTNLVTGSGQVIPSHKHALFATTAFDQGTMTDGTIPGGSTGSLYDGASVVLYHGATVADAICYSGTAATLVTLTTCVSNPFTCEGTAATNPHDNTTGSNADKSLERKPGGAGGNATDTNVSSNDFAEQDTPVPHDIASAAVP